MVRVKFYYWLVVRGPVIPGARRRYAWRVVGVGTRESCLRAAEELPVDEVRLMASRGPVW